MKQLVQLLNLVLLLLITMNVYAAKPVSIVYTDDDVYLRFIQFTPNQIGAFYEGREFAKAAVDKLVASCYVTVIIKNKTHDFLWLDLTQWQFHVNGKKIQQRDIAYWEKQWDEINFKQAHRSTFSWTLLPIVSNLYPQEEVGGRIAIPMQTKPFVVVLNFPTGENKQGKVKTVTMDNMICRQDEK